MYRVSISGTLCRNMQFGCAGVSMGYLGLLVKARERRASVLFLGLFQEKMKGYVRMTMSGSYIADLFCAALYIRIWSFVISIFSCPIVFHRCGCLIVS